MISKTIQRIDNIKVRRCTETNINGKNTLKAVSKFYVKQPVFTKSFSKRTCWLKTLYQNQHFGKTRVLNKTVRTGLPFNLVYLSIN